MGDRKQNRSYELLFGFEKKDIDNTGFLKILKTKARKYDSPYIVTSDENDATRFEDGEKALAFLSGEEELSGWAFHVVKRTVYSEKEKEN